MKKPASIILILLLLPALCAYAYHESEGRDMGSYMEETVSRMEELVSSPSAPLTFSQLAALWSRCGLDAAALPEGDETVSRAAFCRTVGIWLEDAGLSLPAGESLSFSDVEKEDRAWVDALASAGVLGGYDGGVFRPEQTMTAAGAAGALGRLRALLAAEAEGSLAPASSVPAHESADMSALAESCIIGHSHAVGMSLTLDTPMVDYFAISGMSAVDILGSGGFSLPYGGEGTLRQALAQRSYRHVFIILGTNDMPGGLSYLPRFRAAMTRLIETVRELQGDAEIYLLAIAPVGRGYYGYTPGFSLDYITAYNRCLKSLSRDYSIAYLDDFTPLATAGGMMRPELDRGDALHFTAEGYGIMLDTILTHIKLG